MNEKKQCKNNGKSHTLRTGFTTGACLTAATVAGYKVLYGTKPSLLQKVSILFPDGKYRDLDILSISENGKSIDVAVKKDAGDDIDITDGAVIHAKIMRISQLHPKESSDLILTGKSISITLRRNSGVGIVQSNILDVPIGKIAVNPGPQKMIIDNIELLAKKEENLLIEVSVENGEKLAKKTLNSVLGITDGISVLGTSGIVIPCSHNAYKATIKMMIKGAARAKSKRIMAVTGGKTHRLIKNIYPDFPEEQIIRIGDFIQETLEQSDKNNISGVSIICMPGKLAKYALAYGYTHANTIRTDFNKAADNLSQHAFPEQVIHKLRISQTIREFTQSCNSKELQTVYSFWANNALANFEKWNKTSQIELILFGFDSEILGHWKKDD